MGTVGLIALVVIVGLAGLNSVLQSRRARRLRIENIRLKARLSILGDEGLGNVEMAARVMAGLIDATGPVAEAANGARRQREAEGWSPTAAEQMSMVLFMTGLAKLTGMMITVDGE